MFKFRRPGSVQAEIQLETASPNMSVVLQVVSSMDNLGNFSLDRNATTIRSEPGNVPATIPTYNIRHANTYADLKKIFRKHICTRKTDNRAHAANCLAHSVSRKKACHTEKISNLYKSSEKIPSVHKKVKKNFLSHPQKSSGSPL